MIVEIEDKKFNIIIKEKDNNYAALINNEIVEFTPEFNSQGQITALIIDDKRFFVQISKNKEKYLIHILDKPIKAMVKQDTLNIEQKPFDSQHIIINSPMAGLVINLAVKIGQEISKGDQLLVLEAMKMQNDIKSPIWAKVTDISVRVGQTVDINDRLLVLEKIIN